MDGGGNKTWKVKNIKKTKQEALLVFSHISSFETYKKHSGYPQVGPHRSLEVREIERAKKQTHLTRKYSPRFLLPTPATTSTTTRRATYIIIISSFIHPFGTEGNSPTMSSSKSHSVGRRVFLAARLLPIGPPSFAFSISSPSDSGHESCLVHTFTKVTRVVCMGW